MLYTLNLTKTTKNTYRYDNGDEDSELRTLYVQQSMFPIVRTPCDYCGGPLHNLERRYLVFNRARLHWVLIQRGCVSPSHHIVDMLVLNRHLWCRATPVELRPNMKSTYGVEEAVS